MNKSSVAVTAPQNSNSVRGRAAFKEESGENGGIITRGGNVLINEFLQRERRNQRDFIGGNQEGPMSSLENINRRVQDQDNIIISNQERR